MDFCNAQLLNVSKNFDDLISSDSRSYRAVRTLHKVVLLPPLTQKFYVAWA